MNLLLRLSAGLLLLLSLNSCTMFFTGLGALYGAEHYEGHIDYMNRFETKEAILKRFEYVIKDEVVQSDAGSVEVIQVSVWPKKNMHVTWGKEAIEYSTPDARGYIEFQLVKNRVVYWESHNTEFYRAPATPWFSMLGAGVGVGVDLYLLMLLIYN